MKSFDVQTTEIESDFRRAFSYIENPATLPDWTHAFTAVSGGTAMMVTPQGSTPVKLAVKSSIDHGTIDWTIEFPDGSRATAFSRLIDAGNSRSIYSFTLLPPPVPLEQLEGALEQQAKTLQAELANLARILSRRNG
jgi:hypothetical protein